MNSTRNVGRGAARSEARTRAASRRSRLLTESRNYSPGTAWLSPRCSRSIISRRSRARLVLGGVGISSRRQACPSCRTGRRATSALDRSTFRTVAQLGGCCTPAGLALRPGSARAPRRQQVALPTPRRPRLGGFLVDRGRLMKPLGLGEHGEVSTVREGAGYVALCATGSSAVGFGVSSGAGELRPRRPALSSRRSPRCPARTATTSSPLGQHSPRRRRRGWSCSGPWSIA